MTADEPPEARLGHTTLCSAVQGSLPGHKQGPQMGGAQRERRSGEGMLATTPWPGWDGGGGEHEI